MQQAQERDEGQEPMRDLAQATPEVVNLNGEPWIVVMDVEGRHRELLANAALAVSAAAKEIESAREHGRVVDDHLMSLLEVVTHQGRDAVTGMSVNAAGSQVLRRVTAADAERLAGPRATP